MEVKLNTLRRSERSALMLRGIYEKYGYRNFRMAKFEEYSFYLENRDFLESESIIPFTDLNGKLMALKPDVTMSIVKNTRATRELPERVYYAESIYRVSREVRAYREISQIGLEYIGEVTPYNTLEIINLALKSLKSIEDEYVLDISHMAFLTALFEDISCSRELKRMLQACIAEKNAHELSRIAREYALPKEFEDLFLSVISIGGPMGEMLVQAKALCKNAAMREAWEELSELYQALSKAGIGDALRLDFSITSDPKYYNGIMFRGFVQSVPRAVLLGGRYDNLLRRMGKGDLEAIGFALYFDELDRYFKDSAPSPYDAVLLYEKEESASALLFAMEELTACGRRVLAVTTIPEEAKGLPVLRMKNGRVAEEYE